MSLSADPDDLQGPNYYEPFVFKFIPYGSAMLYEDEYELVHALLNSPDVRAKL